MLKPDRPQQLRLPGQQADIAPNSPMAVVALFTEIVRERFRSGNDISWVWEPNPTPLATETGEPPEEVAADEDGGPRKLLIASSFSVHGTARNVRPAIFVRKGPTGPVKTVVNNQAVQHLPTGGKGFFLPARIPITIECVSTQEAESATLADLVWFYLLAAREEVQGTFGIHELGEPMLGETTPFEESKESWSTPVSLDILVNFQWKTVPISPVIREIAIRVKNSGGLDQLVLDQLVR